MASLFRGFGRAQSPPLRPLAPERPAAAGFSGVTARQATAADRSASAPADGNDTPLEILAKPRPEYTEEARRRQVEGEVAVEALFLATGEVRVLRVLEGLGWGLDESARHAAARIRFRPAQRGGRPVDSVAVVRIIFQLAY
jgi:TonB family protein